jgi:hypothetical protein
MRDARRAEIAAAYREGRLSAPEASIDNGYYPDDYSVEHIDVVIDVNCSSCQRLVYRKELRTRNG